MSEFYRPTDPRLHITFVCTGNICRSPMAEKMFAHQITQRGLHDAVRVTSAGTAGCWVELFGPARLAAGVRDVGAD